MLTSKTKCIKIKMYPTLSHSQECYLLSLSS